MSAADIGLSSDETGSVTITMTVNGKTQTYKSDLEGGKVLFDIPAVPSGSQVTVKMDVRDSSGTLLLTGKTSKTVSGTSDAIAVTLSDKVEIPVAEDFNAVFSA
ncbi:MAG: hypothetical protein IJU95_07605, partial [Treponema sp.]|nr:hypothetical protein [Treponema sp.]